MQDIKLSTTLFSNEPIYNELNETLNAHFS